MSDQPTPVRIQRSRRKGSKLTSPNGLPVVCVSRPSIFGNPFTGARAVELYREYLVSNPPFMVRLGDGTGMAFIPSWHHRDDVLKALPRIRGCNVACFCPLDKPCHADVLLELAAAPAPAAPGRAERGASC